MFMRWVYPILAVILLASAAASFHVLRATFVHFAAYEYYGISRTKEERILVNKVKKKTLYFSVEPHRAVPVTNVPLVFSLATIGFMITFAVLFLGLLWFAALVTHKCHTPTYRDLDVCLESFRQLRNEARPGRH